MFSLLSDYVVLLGAYEKALFSLKGLLCFILGLNVKTDRHFGTYPQIQGLSCYSRELISLL